MGLGPGGQTERWHLTLGGGGVLSELLTSLQARGQGEEPRPISDPKGRDRLLTLLPRAERLPRLVLHRPGGLGNRGHPGWANPKPSAPSSVFLRLPACPSHGPAPQSSSAGPLPPHLPSRECAASEAGPWPGHWPATLAGTELGTRPPCRSRLCISSLNQPLVPGASQAGALGG